MHLLPIITPAYPSMCSTHNVTLSTKEVILREIRRADQIADNILEGRAPWQDLFAGHTFFTNGYKYYVGVVAASRSSEAHQIWGGYVESKLRILVQYLDEHESLALAHPFNKGFKRLHHCPTEEDVQKVIHGDLSFHIDGVETEKIDSADDAKQQIAANGGAGDIETTKEAEEAQIDKDGRHIIHTTTFYVGLELPPGRLC
jgi:poly(A) polymerase